MIDNKIRICSKGHTYEPGSRCKECQQSYKRRYYQNNKDEVIARSKKYKQNNKNKVKSQSQKRYQDNKDEVKARSKKWQQENPDNRRWTMRKYRYKITEAGYNDMFKDQNGLCAACKAKPATDVDHCHATEKNRGLLCGPCNRAIGLFEDNPELLRLGAKYLEQYK